MKLVVDNIIFSLQKAGGISVYWYELLKRMVAADVDLTVLERPDAQANIFRKQLDLTGCRFSACTRIPLKLSRYLPVNLKTEAKTILHSSYYRVPQQRSVVSVVTVYDFTYEYFRSGLAKHVHQFQKKRAILRADGIICISDSTRNDLLSLFPDIDNSKVKVVPLAASEVFRPASEFGRSRYGFPFSEKRYALFVGDRTPYKNFDVVVKALALRTDLDLVIVGKPLSNTESVFLEQNIAGRHHLLTGVDSERLNALYNDAFCLLYPSSYEGFGIPLIEAMRAGCPVITTNRSSIPEVCGDAGVMVDDISPDALRQALLALEDTSMRKALVVRGFKQAGKFSWDRTYRETMAFYREICEQKRGNAE